MSEPLTSPRAARLATPRWLDGRLVLGVLLVLVSVVVGARVLAAADATESVWAAARDLAPGSTLGAGDLVSAQVRLSEAGAQYLSATGAAPVGYVLRRGVGAGELLPRGGLVRPDDRGLALREVSVPVAAGHLPEDLRAGQQVDVYVTPDRGAGAAAQAGSATSSPGQGGAGPAAGASPTGTRLVLAGVAVALRPRAAGLASATAGGVVLSVPETSAAALVAAVQAGGVDLVRVPRTGELPALGEPPPAAG